jgi:hypothetical protein
VLAAGVNEFGIENGSGCCFTSKSVLAGVGAIIRISIPSNTMHPTGFKAVPRYPGWHAPFDLELVP